MIFHLFPRQRHRGWTEEHWSGYQNSELRRIKSIFPKPSGIKLQQQPDPE